MSKAPVVYILHGDDEILISRFIEAVREKLGDDTTADLNITRLGSPLDFGELQRAVSAVPFLAPRRLVILDDVARPLKDNKQRARLKAILEAAPQSTAVVVIEGPDPKLTDYQNRKATPWLVKWGGGMPERVMVKAYWKEKGGGLLKWILDEAKGMQGEIRPQAAQHLVSLIGDDKRLAHNELDKLLAYVNYSRAIEVDDVELVTAPVKQADIFDMVDALGARNGQMALSLLAELFAERDSMLIFGMILRQFRLLLLYKDLVSQNQPPAAIIKALGIKDFVLGKIASQARNFDMPELEAIYRRLDSIDSAVKSGRADSMEIALISLVTEVSGRMGVSQRA